MLGMTSHTDLDPATIMNELAEQFAPVLEQSPDGVYLWLDEEHKICNERLASMFGYSVDAWCAAEDFLDSFIAPADHAAYGGSYRAQVKGIVRPKTFTFTGVRKDGSTFAAETDMIPITFAGRPVAYHFVREA